MLTRSGADPVVVERLRTLGAPWFQQLLGRRTAWLQSNLAARSSVAGFADTVFTLAEPSKLDSPTVAASEGKTRCDMELKRCMSKG